jgi:hypothetical protein
MAQKRDARTRARERESARGRRQRQQARAAQTGWLISELAALAGAEAQRWDVVLQIAAELQARRQPARTGKCPVLLSADRRASVGVGSSSRRISVPAVSRGDRARRG